MIPTDGQADKAYPQREPFFAVRFLKLLTRHNVAQQVGADGVCLLMAVVLLEDSNRYRRPIDFTDRELLDKLGVRSWETLKRIRQRVIAAGWLVHQSRREQRKPGRYWVQIPADYLQEMEDVANPLPPENGGSCQPTTSKNVKSLPPKNGSTTSKNVKSLPPKNGGQQTLSNRPIITDLLDRPPDLPSKFDTTEFLEAWSEWEQHRKETGKPLTALAVKKQIKQLAPLTVADAIATIEQSIQAGWAGLFPDSRRNGTPRDNCDGIRKFAERKSREGER